MKKIFSIFICICLPVIFFAQANTKPVIQNLVFEGAGIRGIAYCGVISELELNNMMPSIEKVGGTSAGAITALAISLGYSAKEISDIIGGTNFRKFNDGNFFFAGGIHRIRKYFGWYRGNSFEKWLEKIIANKTGNTDITFEQLHQQGFKDLYTTGTCINKQQLIIFSRKTYPAMKVKDAVRISMSIPLYFEAVFVDSLGNVVKKPKHKEGLDVMVDGGFTGNFPIKIFDTLSQANFATLGFRIDTDKQIENDKAGMSLAPMPVNNLKQYIGAFYNIIIENLNRTPLTNDDWKRTVSISDEKIGQRIRKLSASEINLLIENGRKAVKEYLN